jgi:hypothetical protein
MMRGRRVPPVPGDGRRPALRQTLRRSPVFSFRWGASRDRLPTNRQRALNPTDRSN